MNASNSDVLVHTAADVRWLIEHGSFSSAAKRLGELRLMLERVLSAEALLVKRAASTITPEVRDRVQAETNSLERTLESVASAITHETTQLAIAGVGNLERMLQQHERTARALLVSTRQDLRDADWTAIECALRQP